MGMVEGAEWIVVAIFLIASLGGLYLVVSAQGDMALQEESGENDDDQAADMLIRLVNEARRSIVVHDDGNDSKESVYNNDQVVAAIRDRVKSHRIKVKCLFNDREHLKLLDLADEEGMGSIQVWYSGDQRPDNDIHYKIVDGGRFVQLSAHEHGASERGYVLRKAEPWWSARTRRRISRQYLDHFEHSLPSAEMRASS